MPLPSLLQSCYSSPNLQVVLELDEALYPSNRNGTEIGYTVPKAWQQFSSAPVFPPSVITLSSKPSRSAMKEKTRYFTHPTTPKCGIRSLCLSSSFYFILLLMFRYFVHAFSMPQRFAKPCTLLFCFPGFSRHPTFPRSLYPPFPTASLDMWQAFASFYVSLSSCSSLQSPVTMFTVSKYPNAFDNSCTLLFCLPRFCGQRLPPLLSYFGFVSL